MKDKNNLLHYNQWSSGEYYNSITGVNGSICQTSNEFSSIGEYSFKIIKNNNSGNWVELRATTEGNSFTGLCDIYSLVNGVLAVICTYTDNTQSYSKVDFYANGIQTLSVSTNKNPDKTLNYISLRIILSSYSFIYMDNPSIILN